MGDSITRGTFVWRRKINAYPAQLQTMLGERFQVQNFGVNGHAAQRTADLSYWSSDAFQSSTAFRPDVVLIMLGTNDSRGGNWRGVDAFRDDYRELVLHYQSLESNPAVWLLTPPALFRVRRSTKVRYRMDERAIREICGEIECVARDLGCGLIDINATTAQHPEAFRLDGVHPGAAGAKLIAQTVFEALTGAGSTREAETRGPQDARGDS